MKSFKKFSKRLLKNERGQGMLEYAMLVVIVVAAVLLFKDPLKKMISDKISDLQGAVGSVTTQ